MQVSVASSVRFARAARATGSAAAKPMGGKRPYLLAGQRDFLLARLAEKPDLTLHALLGELRERGVVVSCDTLWRFLRKEKISFKKNAISRRTGSARRRAPSRALEENPGEALPKRLVFIDETWAKTNMTRTHGWMERGLALIAKAPYGHWKTTTFLAALRCDQITAPCVLDPWRPDAESFARRSPSRVGADVSSPGARAVRRDLRAAPRSPPLQAHHAVLDFCQRSSPSSAVSKTDIRLCHPRKSA